MSIRRFMISTRCIGDGTALLGEEHYRHIVRVLRLPVGSPLTLVDETGCEHAAVIERIDDGQLLATITSSRAVAAPASAAPGITVCQAIPKGEKIDLILQKGTELGAQEFWFFGGRRSVVRLKDDQVPAKLARWEKIAAEAARQCGRNTLPGVRWFSTAAEAADAATQRLRLILNEDERTTGLKDALAAAGRPDSIIVAIGPEGGFDPAETGQFTGCGFRSITLGKRILRTETAAIAIVAVLQYIHGDI